MKIGAANACVARRPRGENRPTSPTFRGQSIQPKRMLWNLYNDSKAIFPVARDGSPSRNWAQHLITKLIPGNREFSLQITDIFSFYLGIISIRNSVTELYLIEIGISRFLTIEKISISRRSLWESRSVIVILNPGSPDFNLRLRARKTKASVLPGR